MGDSRYHEDRFLKVFHGSDHEIQKPVYLGGKIDFFEIRESLSKNPLAECL